MPLSSEQAIDHILSALGDALRETKRIGEIEARIGRSRGYFSKVASRKWRISLDVLLETLEVLELDPTTFFTNALAAHEGSEEDRSDRGSGGPSNLADLPPDTLARPVRYLRSRP